MAKYSVKFQVRDDYELHGTAQAIEAKLADLLRSAVFPALNLDEVVLSLEVKRSRN